jgi:hypothetical protein
MASATAYNVPRRRAVWLRLGREILWLRCWWRYLRGEPEHFAETVIRRRAWAALAELAGVED